jgi:hypothetical protein
MWGYLQQEAAAHDTSEKSWKPHECSECAKMLSSIQLTVLRIYTEEIHIEAVMADKAN